MRHLARRGLALAGIATLLPWSAGVALTASVAQASSATGASFTGGAGTRVVNGALFADPGAALTLKVTTDSDTKCVEIAGAHTASDKDAAGKTQWSFALTANTTPGIHTITATAFRSFNSQGKCTANAGEGNGPQTASYTVETDSTAPVVTAAVSPAANAAGWHKDPVSITWSATDFGSGVAAGFPSPASDYVTAETTAAGVTKTSTAKDNAGNAGTGSVTVRLDKTAPAVSASADRAANGADWYNGDVTVSFSATDALSGISTPPAAKGLGEGANQSATGTATDVAGNQGSKTLSGINVDKTAPTLSAAATSSPNAAGWYNGPVTVKWSAADALSGLGAPAPADTAFSTEGANQSVTKTVADKAGNTKSATSPAISIDTTAPNTSAVAPSGWKAIDQTVTLEPHDGLSGVKGTSYKLDGAAAKSGTNVAIAGNGTHTLEYWSVDNAGNEETHKTVEVMIDGSSPTISHTLSPAANAKGWNNADVTVRFDCADTVSGIASCTPDKVIAEEGAGQVVTGTATDNAGNTATDPAVVNLDKTAPSVNGSTDRPANGAGWFKDDVTVSFLANDGLSGVDTFTAPQTLGEGENQSVTGTATDNAGNTGNDTVADIDIDKSAPSLSGAATSAPNDAGWYNGDVKVHWTASDALSGLADAAPGDETITAEGGALAVSATVTDKAGNNKSATVDGIKIDRTAPTTTVDMSKLPDSGWYTNDVSVTLKPGDNLSGVAKTYYKVDGGDAQEYTDTFGHGLNGKHTIAFWSVDKAGNSEQANSIKVWIDGVKPSISGSRSPAANGFGWNNSDVVVSFNCSDADSGIADCSPASTVLANEGAGQKVTGTATDVAGNSASTAVGDINVDKTAPTLDGAATTAANAAGWYKGDVTVDWTSDDNLSGIDPATDPANSVVTGEGDDLGTAEVSVKDKAGNETRASKGGFKIDRTAPVISGGATTQPNAAGWYSGEVTVAFSCTDNLSGCVSKPDNKVLTGNGGAQSVTSERAEDLAGNTTAGKTVGDINIDGLPPQTTADNQCTKTNGWCTGSSANVVLTSTDQTGLSGVKEIRYSVNGGPEQVAAGATKTVSVPLGGTGNATVTYHAVDNAGNEEPANTVGLKWDNIAPKVTHTITPAPNADEWNNSDVTVRFDASDVGSGVDAPKSTPDQTVTMETAFGGLDILGEAFDLAGNKGTDKATVRLDKTAPSIKGEVVAGHLGNNGWYTGPVTVHWTCSDALSGWKVCPNDEVINSNGPAQKASGEAIDAAGNKASATVSVDIDQVDPTVKVGDVDKASYTLGAKPSPTCSASDEHSGLATPCAVSTTGGNANGVGEYTVTATATDKAGNTATDTVKYRVIYNWDGFRQPITDTAHDQGAVSMFKAGSTIPVKYQVKKADGTVVQGAAGSWITPVKGAVTFAPLTDDGTSLAADSGSLFRSDGAGQWIYNWGTAKGDANKQFTIGVRLDDGQVYSTVIGLR